MKINKKKTKILRLNATRVRPINETVEEFEAFRCLGSIIDTRWRTEAEVKTRISKARAAFLRNVWKSRMIVKTTEIRLLNTHVKPVLLYGAETWRINNSTLDRIQPFVKLCLRKCCECSGWTKLAGTFKARERGRQKSAADVTLRQTPRKQC